jgi:hypothetical protein
VSDDYGKRTGGRRKGVPIQWQECPCGRVYLGQLTTCKDCRQPEYQHAHKCRSAGVERG